MKSLEWGLGKDKAITRYYVLTTAAPHRQTCGKTLIMAWSNLIRVSLIGTWQTPAGSGELAPRILHDHDDIMK